MSKVLGTAVTGPVSHDSLFMYIYIYIYIHGEYYPTDGKSTGAEDGKRSGNWDYSGLV